MIERLFFVLLCFFSCLNVFQAGITTPIFNFSEIEDPSTLEIEVLQDWHVVDGNIKTRQKLMTIRVGEFWPGQKYRVPVRMIVPVDQKAKHIHLTGGHTMKNIHKDARLNAFDVELIQNGIGFVYTVVQTLESSGMKELGRSVHNKFIETLNPRHAVKYWGWPASLMRCVTAAHAEKEHFQVGKVAMSGGSKNGASPSAALIHDKRLTAVHASVSPTHESPLRLMNREAWKDLTAYDKEYVENFRASTNSNKPKVSLNHTFLGGAFGPIYNRDAMKAGHSWDDLTALAWFMKDNYFISQHLAALKQRDVDLWFEPGTHDFVAYDVPYGGEHYPEIPMYLKVNSGHGIKSRHPGQERDVQNKQAWLLEHYFEEVEDLLSPPKVSTQQKEKYLQVEVCFSENEKAESGRLFWMYNRGPDGSLAYINDLFHSEDWSEMSYDKNKKAWMAKIPISKDVDKVDFFSNHRKAIQFNSKTYLNYISSPYQSIELVP
jgi:hypothetical protein